MTKPQTTRVELDSCAAEPIHVPGGIQPHGALAVVDMPSGVIVQASANLAAVLGLVARPASLAVIDPTLALQEDLQAWLQGDEILFMRTISLGRTVQVSAHRSTQGLLVEFEDPPASEGETLEALYPRLRRFIGQAEEVGDLQALADATVCEVRALTGFNRVMLYSFDQAGDGTVLAEDGDGVLPSYLDLRFPASDIPAQARALYKLNRLRLIPDVDYRPSPIEPLFSPVDGRALDLSSAALRSVSPIHLQYMRNMGTLSSMSISILVDGQLWGLISGHSARPHSVNPQVRTVCDLLGQIVSLQIASRMRAQEAAEHLAAKRLETRLLGCLASSTDYQEGLVDNPALWIELVGAQGAAIVSGGEVLTVGLSPPKNEIRAMAAWLKTRGEAIFATDSLASLLPAAGAYAEQASGLLAVSISQLHADFILWFRPEVIRTVRWSGDPYKPASKPGDILSPRTSFDLWKEQVRLRSLPWTRVEQESAAEFRSAIQNFVLRRAEERAELTAELERSNHELEAFSYSVSHDLRAPFRHIVGYTELLRARQPTLDETSLRYMQTIIDAALGAGRLVDDLLSFSQLGRSAIALGEIDMGRLVREVLRTFDQDTAQRSIRWEIADLPPACGDVALVRQVLANLIDNALKYTRQRQEATISIEGEDRQDATIYRVRDNGIGFDMAYVGKLFGVFQRLHRVEDFEGTGIGLALCKRIVDRHQGSIQAFGEPGRGATITFTLPKITQATTD